MASTPKEIRVEILMFSHDGFGLGHLRRNTQIATRFVEEVLGASALLVVSTHCADILNHWRQVSTS